jgi:predicted CoA-substrate-specific enzyme activase
MNEPEFIKNILSDDVDGKLYLGIDVGSVSTKCAIINERDELLYATWTRNDGSPIVSTQENLKYMEKVLPDNIEKRICGVGTTGSARYLIKALIGADIAKPEIIAHAIGASVYTPDVRTILEIGGQDSKVILMKNGIVTDFNMNSVCAAGTGSFLDHQAVRIKVPIEEFGDYALRAKEEVSIAGRCTVFAESDMISKQQEGYSKESIIKGLCKALVRNYLNNVCKGKKLYPPFVFQGGVAANSGIKNAFEEELGHEVIIHENHYVMGAFGSAILAREHVNGQISSFHGLKVSELNLASGSFVCPDCPNRCTVKYLVREEDKSRITGREKTDVIFARWNSRCGKW